MNRKLYFTRCGWNRLQREKDELTKKLNRLQAQTAYVAEVGGDQYHDNASYDLLVIDIRGVNWRLTEVHHCLNRAVIVESPNNADRVMIGTSVKIMWDGEETTWEIVGFGESDPDRGLLAYNTPIASLLMKKCKGAVISGTIAGKKTKIEIIEISKGGIDESA